MPFKNRYCKGFEAKIFVPSHAPATSDIKNLAQKNIDLVNYIADLIYETLNNPASFETLLSKIMEHYEIPVNVQQYFLIGFTLKVFLNYLLSRQRVKYYFADNVLFWKAL